MTIHPQRIAASLGRALAFVIIAGAMILAAIILEDPRRFFGGRP